MPDAILDDDSKNFIVWAKRNNVKGNSIQQVLLQKGLDISQGRISQVWSKYKRTKGYGLVNPYQEDVEDLIEKDENLEDEEDEDTNEETSQKNYDVPHINLGDSVIHKVVDKADKEEGDTPDNTPSKLYQPINIEPILRTAELPPKKIKQIKETFEMTEGTWEELQRVLSIAGVPWHSQKAILSHAYGPAVLDIIEGSNKKKDPKDGTKDNTTTVVNMANQLLMQKMAAKQNQLAFTEVEAALKKLEDSGEGVDTIKSVKDLLGLQILASSLGGKQNSALETVLAQKIASQDSNTITLFKSIIDSMKHTDGKEEEFKHKNSLMMHEQVNNLAEELRKQQSTYSETLIKQQMEFSKQMADMAIKRVEDRSSSDKTTLDQIKKSEEEKTAMYLKFLEQSREADQKRLDEMRKLEHEKQQLLNSILQDKVERSIRTEEDWMDHMNRNIEFAERMGLTKKTSDNPNETATRLETIERITTTLPDKLQNGFATAINKLESGLVKYLEYQERRDARLLAHQQNEKIANRQLPERQERTEEEKAIIINELENRLAEAERLKKYKDKMQQLNQS